MFTDDGANIKKDYGFVISLYGYNVHERVNWRVVCGNSSYKLRGLSREVM